MAEKMNSFASSSYIYFFVPYHMASISPPKIDLALDKRKVILGYALTVEGFTSIFLASLLDIKNAKESRTLGNKNSALSFNQKIDLLIDIGALDDNVKAKFVTFMELRNQFMHNMEAKTYEKCFEAMPLGKHKYILKTYPQNTSLSREEQLEAACHDLSKEVITVTLDLYNTIKAKIERQVSSDMNANMKEAFEKTIPQIEKCLDRFVEKATGKDGKLSSESFNNFGKEVSTLLYTLTWANFNAISKANKP